VNGRLVFATPSGVYHFNEANDKIVPDTLMGKEWSDGSKGVFNFARAAPREYLAICVQEAGMGRKASICRKQPEAPCYGCSFQTAHAQNDIQSYRDPDSVIWIGAGTNCTPSTKRFPSGIMHPSKPLYGT
jgi:hypothetical protein